MKQAHSAEATDSQKQLLFWGCFIALITTAFAFTGRVFLIEVWSEEFKLNKVDAGTLTGIGIWPFAVSIILFSLAIDRIGYKTAMLFAFAGHMIWTIMAVAAFYVPDKKLGLQLLYWGSLICALANGAVEAFINPVVATMFSKEKTKWLNILHAGWPGGLVITGLLLIGIDLFAKGTAWETYWALKVGLIALPAIIYFLMLVGLPFPQSERTSSGVSYKEMLSEFGVGGAAIVGVLFVLQMIEFFSTPETPLGLWAKLGFVGLGVALVAAFGIYTQSIGRPLLLFLIAIMIPLATTEIGTDGWITAIMKETAKQQDFHPGWVLVYTSAIMLVMRFFAGPIVHKLSPLGLLAISAALAVGGLYYLSFAAGISIFIAATLYGFGKTFFWPTMLGVVSEQCPRGGALTLNAISGIGMLAVGTLGFPYIGVLQTRSQQAAIVADTALQEKVPGLVADGKVVPVVEKTKYEVLPYKEIDDRDPPNGKLAAIIAKLPADKQEDAKKEIKKTRDGGDQGALAAMALFPAFMLVCYLILIGYFSSKGGYKQVHLDDTVAGHPAADEY